MAYVISDDCIACGTCIDECPVEAISEGDIYSINPDVCTDCGTCADVCPSEAIQEIYEEYFLDITDLEQLPALLTKKLLRFIRR